MSQVKMDTKHKFERKRTTSDVLYYKQYTYPLSVTIIYIPAATNHTCIHHVVIILEDSTSNGSICMLEYSVKANAMFCFACRMFSLAGGLGESREHSWRITGVRGAY